MSDPRRWAEAEIKTAVADLMVVFVEKRPGVRQYIPMIRAFCDALIDALHARRDDTTVLDVTTLTFRPYEAGRGDGWFVRRLALHGTDHYDCVLITSSAELHGISDEYQPCISDGAFAGPIL